jgi:hypothetical protein
MPGRATDELIDHLKAYRPRRLELDRHHETGRLLEW